MTDNPPRWDDEPEDVERFLDAVARRDTPAGDPLAELLAAASRTEQADPRGEERFLAEFRAAEPRPARRRVLRVAVPAALAALALGGIAVAADRPPVAPAPTRLQPTAVTTTHPTTAPPVTTTVRPVEPAGQYSPAAHIPATHVPSGTGKPDREPPGQAKKTEARQPGHGRAVVRGRSAAH